MKIEVILPGIKRNVSLKTHTTFKIGGQAKYFFKAPTKENLILAIKTAKKFDLPFFILGGGSNLLVSDRGYKGLVIKQQTMSSKIQDNKIFTEAGLLLGRLVNLAAKNNLIGLEWAVGIPGTIGGAIRGNAGAFGKSMKDIVGKVEVYDIKDKKIKTFKNKNCHFDYRESIFKRNPNLIILSAELQLKKGPPVGGKKEIKEKMKEYLDYRKKTQPLEFSSAGSIFKNPLPSQVLKKFRRARIFSAGELIEKCGLKGKKIGKVKISRKHANFIINLGNGKAKDVKKLIKLIKDKVKNKFGIVLEEEIQCL